jgi:hypothetical protein
MGVVALAALSVGLLPCALSADSQRPSLPAALESFLTQEARGSASDRALLLAGEPAVKLLDADPAREIAVFGAVWVDAPTALYVERVKNIEQFEQGRDSP